MPMIVKRARGGPKARLFFSRALRNSEAIIARAEHSSRSSLFVCYCEGFRTPAVTNVSPRTAAGVRKPPRDETAGRGTYWAVPRAQLWGFGCGRATAEVGSEVG